MSIIPERLLPGTTLNSPISGETLDEPNDTSTDCVGSCDALNVGAGDLKLSFDKSKPDEVEKSKQAVQDMLKRGYTILVEIPDEANPGQMTTKAVKEFDPETCEYLIAPPQPKRRGRKPGQRVAASTTRATAVAPTAGG